MPLLSQKPTIPIPLRLLEPGGSPHLPVLQDAARAIGTPVSQSEPANVDALAEEEPLVGIGPGIEEPLPLAHRVRARHPRSFLVLFAASVATRHPLYERVRADPVLRSWSDVVAIDDAAVLAERLRAIAERIQSRQRQQEALEQIEHQLSGASHGTPERADGVERGTAPDSFLASILAQASDAIISTDRSAIILTWNHGARQLFGYEPADIIGRPLGALDPPRRGDDTALSLSEAVRRLLRTRTWERYDTVCRHADGSRVEVAASLAPIRDAEGEILGASIIARDVSDRRRVEEELRRVNRQKDEFLATISHELRTPLTAINGYTDMLLRGLAGPMPSRINGYVANIRGAGERLLSIVNALLDYSRLEAGSELARLEPVALQPAVERAVNRLRASLAAKHLHLEVAAEHQAIRVMADDEHLQQILAHYLSNAIKFTPEGGRIRVTIGFDPEHPGMGRVAVSDTGVGVGAEHLDRIWDRFYQADSSLTRQHGGMGLGLAIVAHIALLHRARVWAESPGPGRGSTFYVALPLARSQVQPLAS